MSRKENARVRQDRMEWIPITAYVGVAVQFPRQRCWDELAVVREGVANPRQFTFLTIGRNIFREQHTYVPTMLALLSDRQNTYHLLLYCIRSGCFY